jgi:hypothetical protein
MFKKGATENGGKCCLFSASAVMFLLLTVQSALAALGGDAASVQVDQARMRATVKSITAHGYTVHELTTPTGVVIRQYTSSSGRVFGVSWRGPFMPNLPDLLGSHFQRFSFASRAVRSKAATRYRLSITDHDLVLESAGHMRDYSGRAYDPTLLPQGVDAHEVR